MKILGKNPREGIIRVRPENLDDLWHLHNLLEIGDLVTSATYRTAEEISDKIRAEKTEKKKMTLTLRVERVEFHDFSDRLRILGTIAEGERDLGMHHTFNVEAGQFEDIKIQKPGGLKQHHWDRIKEAEAAARRPLVTILSMDDEEAAIAVLRQYGVHVAATVKGRTGGKQYEDKSGDPKKDYFGEVWAVVKRTRAEGTPLIVVGPGFTREEFLAFVKEREPEFLQGSITEGTGQAGTVGVHEALKRGIVERIQADQQVAVDTRLVETIMSEIARDGPVAFGEDEVAKAIGLGAVEQIVLTDELLRTKKGEEFLTSARNVGAKGHVVAVAHEAGTKLKGLGGVAALLRYKIAP
jgi:protein pelota